MANRKPVREERDPFSDEDMAVAPTMMDHAGDLFDEARKKEDKRQFVRSLNIMSILPDPAQPRRALPHAVRMRWDGKPESLPYAFEAWRRLAEAERKSDLDLRAYVMAERDRPELDESPYGPLETSLLLLADLAANIRRNGLMNPMTVVRLGNAYQIETGERRWLAHHLLYMATGDESWLIVSARVVDVVSVWRQAGENSTRTNLNAVSKARQFALLLMDLYQYPEQNAIPEHSRADFKGFKEVVPLGGCDRAYYVQVADSDQYRIPKGKGELMLNAMGVKGRATFSRYRALLHLPDEVWQMGDDFNWSDDRLYLLATLDPKQAVQRARQMKRRDDARRSESNVLSQNNSAEESLDAFEEQLVQSSLETADFKRRTIRVARMVDRIGRLSKEKRREGLDEITIIRRWLEEAERVLRDEPL